MPRYRFQFRRIQIMADKPMKIPGADSHANLPRSEHENLESDLRGGGKRLFFEVPLGCRRGSDTEASASRGRLPRSGLACQRGRARFPRNITTSGGILTKVLVRRSRSTAPAKAAPTARARSSYGCLRSWPSFHAHRGVAIGRRGIGLKKTALPNARHYAGWSKLGPGARAARCRDRYLAAFLAGIPHGGRE